MSRSPIPPPLDHPQLATVILAFPLLYLVGAVALEGAESELYTRLVMEGGVVEMVGVGVFGVSALLALGVAASLLQQGRAALFAWWLAVAGGAVLAATAPWLPLPELGDEVVYLWLGVSCIATLGWSLVPPKWRERDRSTWMLVLPTSRLAGFFLPAVLWFAVRSCQPVVCAQKWLRPLCIREGSGQRFLTAQDQGAVELLVALGVALFVINAWRVAR